MARRGIAKLFAVAAMAVIAALLAYGCELFGEFGDRGQPAAKVPSPPAPIDARITPVEEIIQALEEATATLAGTTALPAEPPAALAGTTAAPVGATVTLAGVTATPAGPPAPPPEAKPKGPAAPDFTLANITGDTVSLSSFRGNVVAITFFSTHCEICREQILIVDELYQKVQGWPIKVIGVTDGTRQEASALAGKYKLAYPILLDPKGKVIRRYKVRTVPTTILIYPDGTIAQRYKGFIDLGDLEIYKEITALATPSSP